MVPDRFMSQKSTGLAPQICSKREWFLIVVAVVSIVIIAYRTTHLTIEREHLLVHYISSSLFETLRFWYPPHFGSVDVYEHSQLVVIILVVIFVSLCVSGKQWLTTQILSK